MICPSPLWDTPRPRKKKAKPPTISFQCPECLQTLKAPATAGGRAKCPVCSIVVAVPRVVSESQTDQAAVEWTCPLCDNPLHLTREQDGQYTRCRECDSILKVSTHPWAMTIHTAGRRPHAAIADPNPDGPSPPTKSRKKRHTPKWTDTPTAADAATQAIWAAKTPPLSETSLSSPHRPQSTPAYVSRRSRRRTAPGSAGRGLPLSLALAVSVAIASVLIGILLVARALWRGDACDGRFRYLPHQYDAYTTLNVPQLLKSPIYSNGHDRFPLPPRLEVFQNFLARLEIPLSQVRRISFAGDARHNSGGVIVYETTESLDAEQVLARAARDSSSQTDERVGGKRFRSLGPVAICIAEPTVFLVGRTDLLRATLERAENRQETGILHQTVSSLDFRKTSLGVCAGLPRSELMRNLMRGTGLGAQVAATVDEATYEDNVWLTRTLAMPDERSANDLARFLKVRVRQISDDADTGDNALHVLQSIRISADKSRVVLQLILPSDDLAPSLVAFLNRAY
jgi:hypothetical protein